MQICPKCNRKSDRLLALSREDNKTMICDECGIKEAIYNAGISNGKDLISETRKRPMSAYERTKAQVYATGNKWAIENFEATHN